jgi:hypothetical protein
MESCIKVVEFVNLLKVESEAEEVIEGEEMNLDLEEIAAVMGDSFKDNIAIEVEIDSVEIEMIVAIVDFEDFAMIHVIVIDDQSTGKETEIVEIPGMIVVDPLIDLIREVVREIEKEIKIDLLKDDV